MWIFTHFALNIRVEGRQIIQKNDYKNGIITDRGTFRVPQELSNLDIRQKSETKVSQKKAPYNFNL